MSTVAKKVLMGSGAVGEVDVIEQSLIFDETRGSFLGRASSAISAGNQRTFTFSTWVKICSKAASANNTNLMMARPTAGGGPLFAIMVLGTEKQLYIFEKDDSSTGVWVLHCSAVLRDPAAWYHIVVAVDTTQGAEANRVKPYINGVLQTSFVGAGYPDQNAQMPWNEGAEPQYLGWNVGSSGDFYMAETHSIDGAAKAASDFGETNSATGQWIPKEYTGGSYGTNGFYFKFASGAIGTDSSGESNNYTATNLANSDVVIDTPTNNFATLNPLYTGSVSNTFSEGNLKIVTPSTGYGTSTATIVPTSGKYYAEFKGTTGGDNGNYGVRDVSMAATNSTWLPAGSTKNMAYQGSNGNIYYNGSSVLSSAPATFTTNDVIAVAIDYDNSTVKWYKNNSLQYTATSADLENVTFAAGDSGNSTTVTAEANFGQKTLAYTPPSGYVALSTANLPDPAIPLPSAHFNTVLYTGNATQRDITVGFQPDLIWIKKRNGTTWNEISDSLRSNTDGNLTQLYANSTDAEYSSGSTNYIGPILSNGFRMSVDAVGTGLNANGDTYVNWNWKANGAGSQNTDGSINSTATSANQTAGFSIVTYTGNNQAATVGHGLGVAPDLVIVKSIGGAGSWHVYNGVTSSDSENYYMLLDATTALTNSGTGTVPWNNTRATSSVFSVGGANASTNINNATYLAYCFASKPSFSKVGIYTGNGNASGPMVNTGFKPAWLMIKNTSNAQDWMIWDTKRNPFNEVTQFLYPNLSADEGAGSNVLDLVSNGFKLRNAGTRNRNYNGDVYLYMAFAESPFKTANAR